MKAYELLSIRQVDEKIKQLKLLKTNPPTACWIDYLRKILGLSTRQLAKLMGIKQSSVFALSKRELDKTITLATLEKTANAMGCELLYAFVPKTSLENFVETKQVELVNNLLEQTNLTMSLEKQGLSKKDTNMQKELLLKDIKNKSLKYLWVNL